MLVVLFVAAFSTVVWLVLKMIADDKNEAKAIATSRAFESALEAGRMREAYSLTTQRLQQGRTFEEFSEMIERHPALRGPPSPPWTEENSFLPHQFGSKEFSFKTEVTNRGQFISFTYVVLVDDGVAKVDSITFH
jgi:hypothetical protein